MATMTERPETEYMTGLYDRYHKCDSIEIRRYFGRDSLEKAEIETALFASYCFRQEHPNEQFYYADSELDANTLRFSDISGDIESQEDDDSEDLSTKQAFEVAAAARFISKVDIVTLENKFSPGIRSIPRPRLGSTTSVRDSILDGTLTIPKLRSSKMQVSLTSKRSKAARPPPLMLDQAQSGVEEIQSPLPTRTSSKGAPSFDIARPVEPAMHFQRSITSPSLGSEPRTPLSVLTPESANTFQFDFSFSTKTRNEPEPEPGTETEPSLSRSGSGATTDSQSPPTPPFRPSEDQIRQEIEAFALEQAPFMRGSRPRHRKPPLSDIDDRKQSHGRSLPSMPVPSDAKEVHVTTDAEKEMEAIEKSEPNVAPDLRRKKSIFGWLQKKPEKPDVDVDDLIDLYMTDEQRGEIRTVKRRPSRAKLTVFRNRVITDPLPVKIS